MLEREGTEQTTRVVDIETPYGVHTIAYGAHDRQVDLAMLPDSFSAFTFEWPSDDKRELPEYFSEFGRLFHRQFDSVLRLAENKRIPVYNIDAHVRGIIGYPEMLLPETPTSGPREALMAHKQDWLLRENADLDRLVAIVGASHTGLEKELKRSLVERLERIRRKGLVFRGIMRKSSIYTISRFDYDGNSWQRTETLEVPELKNIAKR